jgi:regulator of sigma E protease
MFSIFVFILVLSILILVHEFGHFLAARRCGVRVQTFSLGFGPVLWRRKKAGTEYCLSLIPLGGYVKMAGDNLEEYTGKSDEYYAQPPGARFQIIFWGPLLNYVLGFLCFWVIFATGYPMLIARVGAVLDGFGAQKAGIIAGDKILAVDGKEVVYWTDMVKLIQDKREEETVSLRILRKDKEIALSVPVKEKEYADQLGRRRSAGLIGITPADDFVIVRHGVSRAFLLGLSETWDLTVLTYQGLWRLLTGRLSVRESVTGPLGIFFITSKAAQLGLSAILRLVAILSVSLGLFNLLPFPVLDGGHILFLGLEKLRGKTLSIKAERLITQLSLSAIICFVLFVTYNDILRIFGDKFSRFIK